MANSITLPEVPALYLLSISLPLLILCESKSFRAGHAVSKLLSSAAFVSGPLVQLWTKPPQTPVLSSYCALITTGLLLSALGDFFLIPSRAEYDGPGLSKSVSTSTPSGRGREKKQEKATISISFQLGMVAFAAAHIAYIFAFLQDTQEPLSQATFTATFVATMILAKLLGVIPYPVTQDNKSSNILSLSIPTDMRLLVTAYALIISSMLAVAASTTPPPSRTPQWSYQRLLGAAMFVVSDIFVAKDAFGGSKLRKDGGRQPNHWLRNTLGFGLYFWAQMVIAGTVR